MDSKFTVFVFLLFFSASKPSQSIAQNFVPVQNASWTANWEPVKTFIENKGQFDGRNRIPGSEILFAVDHGPAQIFFTKNGLTYRFDKKEKNFNRKEGDKSQPKVLFSSELVNMQWENSNPGVQIITEEKTTGYLSYSYDTKEGTKSVNHVSAYKKIVYKNLYSNIDVEYIFHPEGGIKYSLILHPGADVSKVRMLYPDAKSVSLNEKGDIRIPTMFGDIIDHAPFTFLAGNHENISSSFLLENNRVTFSLPNAVGFGGATVVIDPWTQTPTLPNSNAVMECERDNAGNVYILGGESPMKLLKYDSAGTIKWTHSTPYDTANFWLGTFATDLAGNSYVTTGSIARLEKVDANANVLWTWAPGAGSSDEYWSIAFDCDYSKLVIGGTSGNSFPVIDLKGTIFNVDTGNGNVLDTIIVGAFFNTFPNPYINEARSVSSGPDGKYYYVTLDTIGCIRDSSTGFFDTTVFAKNHQYNIAYKSENYRPLNGNGGIKAIRAGMDYLYTQNGVTVAKRSLGDGNILSVAAIPGGISVPDGNRNKVGNSGIDVDACGNVYVGSGTALLKYDADLTLVDSIPTPYKVYDVTVSSNGSVIICGATGDNTDATRTGYVQSVSFSACDPIIFSCCNAAISSPGKICSSDTAIIFEAVTHGGIWSGTAITDSITGIFNPSLAGFGNTTLYYSLDCGMDSITVTVDSCMFINVCKEQNGDLSAINGGSPYTWEVWNTDTTFAITNQSECISCNSSYTWFGGTCLNGFVNVISCYEPGFWSFLSNDSTISPGASDTFLVSDNYGNSFFIGSQTVVPSCWECPAFSVFISNLTQESCNGTIGGSFTVSANNGFSPFDYFLVNSTGDTIAVSNNQSNPVTFYTLQAGTYTVYVTDNINCTDTVVVNISAENMALILNSTPSQCDYCNGGANVNVNGGNPPYSYLWSNGQTTQAATGLCAGNTNVMVTDNTGCVGYSSVVINNTVISTIVTSAFDSLIGIGTATVTASGGTSPYFYQWSNGQTTATATGLSAGVYYITVSDFFNCTTVETVYVGIVGLTENSLGNEIRIFPNPAWNELLVQLNDVTCKSLKISICDLLGKEVLAKEVENPLSKTFIPLDISKFSPGVYFISVILDNENPVKMQFIKE